MPRFKRTHIYLPEELFFKLKAKARIEGSSISAIMRAAIAEYLGEDGTRISQSDVLWEMVGASKTKDRDLSENHDEYLYGKTLS